MFTFIDLFAGIGGFHQALHNLGGECVFASESDPHARKTYEINFKNISPSLFTGDTFWGDITTLTEGKGSQERILEKIPPFQVLTGGFPCQPFSHAGYKKGFSDARGTLFNSIKTILQVHQPEAYLLENVAGFLTHDNGNTFNTVRSVLEDELGYSFYAKKLKASDYGLPQHRPRMYMVGFKDKEIQYSFPDPVPLMFTMSDVFGAPVNRDIGFTLRVGGRGSGLGDRHNWDSYLVDGREERLSLSEGKQMMGFPETFILPCSETQSFKQLGNAVAVPVAQAVAQNMLPHLIKLS